MRIVPEGTDTAVDSNNTGSRMDSRSTAGSTGSRKAGSQGGRTTADAASANAAPTASVRCATATRRPVGPVASVAGWPGFARRWHPELRCR